MDMWVRHGFGHVMACAYIHACHAAHRIVLHCIAFQIVLHGIALHCIYIALHDITSHRIAFTLPCMILHRIALHYIYIVLHDITLIALPCLASHCIA